ncbi:MAG: indole-3-glycerol phosphate synthase TrpC [Lachnospiraceae bacterium]|nr:indole-3-glycerol phosphate synthase TrpC [Lachnospiraceae bacterium]
MANNILNELADAARVRVSADKEKISPEKMKELAVAKSEKERADGGVLFPVERALEKEGISFICEVKKASPSKGIIAVDFPYTEIAKEYDAAGAACISVLTEPTRFLGSDAYLEEIVKVQNTPVLRKDFTVDVYQIYQAKVLGASMVLLICALLSEDTIRSYIRVCDELGLSALVEAHDDEEIAMAVRAGARIIGVNNRNLKDFTVDVHNSERLRKLVPKDVLFVAESGIKTAEDIRVLYEAGVNGVLIGETLMRAADKKAMLDELRKGCRYE